MVSRSNWFCGVTSVFLAGAFLPWAARPADRVPYLTPAPAGPYRVEGNRILNSKGRPYLARGTELPTLTLRLADIAGDGAQFGAFSPSSLVSIRQRLNMNAVRLPVSPLEFENSSAYRARAAEVVQSANRFELLVILAADPAVELSAAASAQFWQRCAGEFKSAPNVFFATGAEHGLVEVVRSAGANQPVVVEGAFQVRDPNVIYQATPRYATTRTNEDRWRQFGALAARAPVLVSDMDPQLDQRSTECAAFPGDPGAATKLVQDSLDYFDAHQISWVLSSYRPGRMVTEYRYFNWSKLDDGWTCGESPSRSGIAMVLGAHLWGVDPHGLFPVNHVNGGMVLARGGLSTAYGPILADREALAPPGNPLPLRLANVSVRVTDSRGIARMARLQYTGAGWSNVTYVVPPEAAAGPAEIAVLRSDGSKSTAKFIVADVAPGFFSASSDARGAAVGDVTQRSANGGRPATFPASQCVGYNCRAVPIPLSAAVRTTVRLAVSGIRYADPHAAIHVTVGGLAAPLVSFGAVDDVGHDQVTIELPAELRGRGETDLAMTVNGRVSNVVRIHCGAQ